ncbi:MULTISPECIES: ribonuclease P protein component [unclassified Fusibacter]|uniref:ribonuclease P protein component n=1 Tax=unclassified Fusibacter TaxID=2624464 RepID=UPI001012BB38|nr:MULTISPECIES: ribonuclease P protein component [unclassified Fusibacter]MCK8060849.1 ribonuclease P protein component [Fusibacter sp. A2]NPE23145.1 ribonuclease P protein component [Fusibacter sp. A1]RXV59503.1 ribonuclease P protein component [Fusibacter sp. A1]
MKIDTLKKNEEFKTIYKRGKSHVGAYLVLYSVKNDTDAKQFGITVSKKVGNAVNRNRIRRLVKEAIRLNDSMIPVGYDYVIVSRVRATKASYQDIEKNLLYLVRQLKKEAKK